MEAFAHQVIAGLATGGIYASLALALVMIYNATHHVNFAQGELAMFSTYLCWTMLNAGWSYWAAFFATLAIAFVLGAAIERIIVRPVESAPVLTVVVVFIGLLVILNSLAGWIYSYTIKSFPSPFPTAPPFGSHLVTSHELGAICVTLIVLLLIFLFFRYTPLGLAMRAASQNPDSSRLVGIRVGWMLALGWGMAAAIGATAGMMVAEIIGGTIYGSMALIADGWHMSTHAGALAIAALSYRFARRHAPGRCKAGGTGRDAGASPRCLGAGRVWSVERTRVHAQRIRHAR